jgi:hypothetical protein
MPSGISLATSGIGGSVVVEACVVLGRVDVVVLGAVLDGASVEPIVDTASGSVVQEETTSAQLINIPSRRPVICVTVVIKTCQLELLSRASHVTNGLSKKLYIAKKSL